jgi:hypothetical protein
MCDTAQLFCAGARGSVHDHCSKARWVGLRRGIYALYTLDASGNVASWNAGAELIEGYKAEEIRLVTGYPVTLQTGGVDAHCQGPREQLCRRCPLAIFGERGSEVGLFRI